MSERDQQLYAESALIGPDRDMRTVADQLLDLKIQTDSSGDRLTSRVNVRFDLFFMSKSGSTVIM